MTPLAIEEVQTVLHLLQRNRVFLCPMLQDKLFKVQECAFMRDLLPHLDKGLPGVLCSQFRTVGALSVLDQVLDLEYLL